jgi:hypothetical protein
LIPRASRFTRITAAALASSALVLTIPANAQAPGKGLGAGVDIDIATLSTAKVGSWADYTMTVPTGATGVSPKVRYAIVEKSAGKIVLEIDTETPKGEVDMRLDFAAQGADAWRVTSGKIKLGPQLIDMPAGEISAAPVLKKGGTPGDLVGVENVVTGAGTFACKHYRKTLSAGPMPGAPAGQPAQTMVVELWMNEKVSPTGLVKSSLGPMSLVLAATGEGAQAKVK